MLNNCKTFIFSKHLETIAKYVYYKIYKDSKASANYHNSPSLKRKSQPHVLSPSYTRTI